MNEMSIEIENKISEILERQFEKVLSRKIENIINEKVQEVIDATYNKVVEETEEIIQETPDVDDEQKEKITKYLQEKMNRVEIKSSRLLKEVKTLSEKLKIRDIEKFMIDNGINSFTKRRFLYYIEQGVIPEPIEKNKNQATYSKEHILNYLIVNQISEQLGIDKTKHFIDIIEPYIKKEGLFNTVKVFQEIDDLINDETIKEGATQIANGILEGLKKSNVESDDPQEYQEYMVNIIVLLLFNSISKQFTNSFELLIEDYKVGSEKRRTLDKIIDMAISCGDE